METRASFDVVGKYDQDRINGFRPALLDRLMEAIEPGTRKTVLDAMSGDGNLTHYLYRYCQKHNTPFPSVTTLDYSRVQSDFAKEHLASLPVQVCHGDVLTMKNLETDTPLEANSFDCVVIKSGNHEIRADRQRDLYQSVFRVLKPGGVFVNLGFLFQDEPTRDEFADITRCKDRMVGMHEAVVNRFFSTDKGFYARLEKAGFESMSAFETFNYEIHTEPVVEQYFANYDRHWVLGELQASWVRAIQLRRSGRIVFEKEHGTMYLPGEITVAH